MGKKKSFYFSDEDIEMYEQVKLYAGESLSSIVTDAFKEFLRKRQLDEKQYAEVKIWRGSKDLLHDIADIEQFKFTGKELTRTSRDEGRPDDTISRRLQGPAADGPAAGCPVCATSTDRL